MSSTRRISRSMSRNATRGATTLGIVGSLAGLTLTGPVGVAAARAAGDPQVLNQETVQVKLDPSGELDVARLYSQLTVLGQGTVGLEDPTSREGLRDLDGFSRPVVRDGKAQYSITVDGREQRRTVSDYDGELPVTFEARYELDGERISPDDLVGRSGKLSVTYDVVNRTAEPTEITYKNGKGEDVTETVDLVTPYVASLRLSLPKQFQNVSGDKADDGGDGRGGTSLSWTMALFDFVGSPAQRITWTADVTDAELPPATLQVVPVDAGGNSALPNARTSFAEGAASATQLTGGIFKVDGKLLELRTGAQKLLEGLVKLQDGADKLNAGLADTAAPGAQQLADGAGQLTSGLRTASDGSEQLADGLATARTGGSDLSNGLGQLADGNRALSEGLRSSTGAQDLTGGAEAVAGNLVAVAEGLADLDAGVDAILDPAAGLPAAMRAGAEHLKAGIDAAVAAAIGTPSTPETLLNGIARIQAGLDNPDPATPGVRQGLALLLGQAGQPGLPQALLGVEGSLADLEPKVTPAGGSEADPADPTTPLNQLSGAATAVGDNIPGALTLLGNLCAAALPSMPASDTKTALTNGCNSVTPAIPQLSGAAAAVGTNVPTLIDSTNASWTKLLQLQGGLDAAVGGLERMQLGVGSRPAAGTAQTDVPPTLLGGLYLLGLGLDNPTFIGGKPGLKQGLAIGISGGIDQYVDAVLAGIATDLVGDPDTEGTLKFGTSALSAGAAQLATGAGTLSDKLGDAADGADKLAEGSAAANAGGQKLAGGLGQLADGGKKLSDGLPAAVDGAAKIADGAQQLADGLGDAADGSAQIADGVGQVTDGVAQVEDGARRLSGEGTSLLGGAANGGAATTAKKVAMLQAMSDKAESGALPYGAPEGAVGEAAFSYVLAGANSAAEDNTTRGAAALALLAMGSLAGMLVRRRAGD